MCSVTDPSVSTRVCVCVQMCMYLGLTKVRSDGLEVSSVPSGGAVVSAGPRWMSSVWLQAKGSRSYGGDP